MCTLIGVVLANPFSIAQFSQRPLLESMWDAQANYQWNLTGIAPKSANYLQNLSSRALHDTRAWDATQSRGCCGIDGYDDWARVRPDYLPSNSLPQSCCPRFHMQSKENDTQSTSVTNDNNNDVVVCGPNNSYRMGCRQLYEKIEAQRTKINLLIGLMQLVVAILFYMIEHQTNPDNPPAQIISDHTSLVNMQNALKNATMQQGYGTYIEPNTNNSIQQGLVNPNSIANKPIKANPLASDTVFVGEDTPYKSTSRR